MSQKEVQRLQVVNRVMAGELSQVQAAQLMGLSVRQVKRLCGIVRQQGTQGLISRKRGQPSHRRIPSARREQVVQLLRDKFADFGPLLAHEYLKRDHGFA